MERNKKKIKEKERKTLKKDGGRKEEKRKGRTEGGAEVEGRWRKTENGPKEVTWSAVT